jgi:phosphoglucomutase
MMIDLRTSPMTEIDGEKVKYTFDYENSVRKNLLTGEKTTIDLPKSNVLVFLTENGTRIAARPSGTEPKIKFYFSTNTSLDKIENAAATENILDRKIERIIKELSL